MVPTRWQAIIWTNDGLGYWCIYPSLSLNESMYFLDWKYYILIKISIKFLSMSPIDNKSTLVPVMAGCRSANAITWSSDVLVSPGHNALRLTLYLLNIFLCWSTLIWCSKWTFSSKEPISRKKFTIGILNSITESKYILHGGSYITMSLFKECFCWFSSWYRSGHGTAAVSLPDFAINW